jgi:histidine triad (HIT) family protein
MSCVFCKIASGEIPTDLVYEDELVVAFRDIRPLTHSHVLVVPRAHVASLWELDDRDLAGALLHGCAEVARSEGLEQGFRVITNAREHGRQEVPHLHLHVIGGQPLGPMLADLGQVER